MPMSERQWERAGSASGVGFVAAMIVSVFMVPAPPHINASTTEILDYVTSHRTSLLSSALVGALAGVLFLVFLGHLRHVLQRSEGGVQALSPIVYRGRGLQLQPRRLLVRAELRRPAVLRRLHPGRLRPGSAVGGRGDPGAADAAAAHPVDLKAPGPGWSPSPADELHPEAV